MGDTDKLIVRVCEVGRIIEDVREGKSAAEKVCAGCVDRQGIKDTKAIGDVRDGANKVEGDCLGYFWPFFVWNFSK